MEENGDERYLVECFEHRIIPFSKIQLEFAGSYGKDKKYEWGWRIPKTFDPVVESPVNAPLDVKNKSIDALVQGGRFHKIRANLADKAFESFKMPLMGQLFKVGDEAWEGDLWLTTYHLTGY